MRPRRGAKTAMPKKNKSQWQKKKKDHSRSHYLLGGSGHHYEQKEDNCKDREQVLARPFFFPLETSNTIPETGENRKVNAKNSDCSGRRCAFLFFFSPTAVLFFAEPRFFFFLETGEYRGKYRTNPGVTNDKEWRFITTLPSAAQYHGKHKQSAGCRDQTCVPPLGILRQ